MQGGAGGTGKNRGADPHVLATGADPADRQHDRIGQPMRRFKDVTYRTLKSWSRRRRVIGKAEHLPKGSNPRFVLTSLSKKTIDAHQL